MKSWYVQDVDSLAILKSDVELIDDHTYVTDDGQLIVAETVVEIENEGNTYLVFEGSEIRTFAIIPHVTAKLEATSDLLADEMPIGNLDIELQGESYADVWVMNHLSGRVKASPL
jgi:hypothetical protein